MKKFLAALLAVFMVVACFAACGDKTPDKTEPSEGNQGIPGPDTTHTHTFVEGKCECGESDPNYVPPHQHTFVDGKCECGESEPIVTPEEIVFEDVDETVYVDVTTLILRATTEFGIETNIKGYVSGGTALKRTGFHKDWSRVEYEGEVLYCATNCLTTVNPNPELGFTFTEVNEKVSIDTTAYKAEDGTLPSARYYLVPVQGVDEYVAGYLPHGTIVLRTGVYYEPVAEGETDEGLGWSRIQIDGVDYFIRNSMVVVVAEPETPDVLPEGYAEYNNTAISFVYPEAWTLTDGTPAIIADGTAGNNITVAFGEKAGVWTEMTADIYTSLMSEQLALLGMTISDVAVEQLTASTGEAITKITQTTTVETASMLQTLLVITVGEYDYTVTVTEVVAAEGLVDAVVASLKSVQ